MIEDYGAGSKPCEPRSSTSMLDSYAQVNDIDAVIEPDC
jgi:hypothetical protein